MGNEPGGGPSAPGAKGPALVWFRSDLRVTDHEALCAANQGATSLVPVYCFDPREYGQVSTAAAGAAACQQLLLCCPIQA